MHPIPLQFYDNGGRTADRYIVLYEQDKFLQRYNYISMSLDPDSPLGISQSDWCDASCARDGTFGKRLSPDEVPHNVLLHALKRLSLIV